MITVTMFLLIMINMMMLVINDKGNDVLIINTMTLVVMIRVMLIISVTMLIMYM